MSQHETSRDAVVSGNMISKSKGAWRQVTDQKTWPIFVVSLRVVRGTFC